MSLFRCGSCGKSEGHEKWCEHSSHSSHRGAGMTKKVLKVVPRRMTVKRATKEGRKIIRCCYCKKQATWLDHCWPYGEAMCEEHRERLIW